MEEVGSGSVGSISRYLVHYAYLILCHLHNSPVRESVSSVFYREKTEVQVPLSPKAHKSLAAETEKSPSCAKCYFNASPARYLATIFSKSRLTIELR